SFRVTNTGVNDALGGVTAKLSDAAFTYVPSQGTCDLTLKAGASCRAVVAFSLAEPGSASGTLTLTDADGDTVAVALVGTASGLLLENPQNAPSYQFGDQTIN